jgi:hypothetical protein
MVAAAVSRSGPAPTLSAAFLMQSRYLITPGRSRERDAGAGFSSQLSLDRSSAQWQRSCRGVGDLLLGTAHPG